jgi:hypothetical protein
MHKIEDAVRTQRSHHNPKRRPEAEYGCCEEGSRNQRLENKRTR